MLNNQKRKKRNRRKIKLLILAVLFFAIAGAILPNNTANAGAISSLVERPISSILFSILFLIGQAAQYISLTFLGWAGGLFNYVLSPDFNSLSLTNTLFVKQGWTLTRNFANMFFMMIMLVIAFSTILRVNIGQINLKNTLPRLIIAALLINFSRVIAGLVIDAGQIVMVTFTNGASNDGNLAMFLYNQMKAGAMFASPSYTETVSGYGAGLKSLAEIFFGAAFPFIAALAFFILAFMLVLRIVVIWLLVIFAPLAWLAMIIPNTKTYWNKWWDYFLRWTFLGAIVGFFMYLAVQMAATLSSIEQFSKEVGNDIDAGSNFLSSTSNLLQYFAIIVMLYISIFAAKKVNSAVVSATFKVLNTAKKSITTPIKSGAKFGYEETGIPTAWKQVKQHFQEKTAIRREKTGGKILQRIERLPGLKEVGDVARKRERALLQSQFKDLPQQSLINKMIKGQGMEETVATEIFKQRKMQISIDQFAQLKEAVKTEEGQRNLKEWAEETKNEHYMTKNENELKITIQNMGKDEFKSHLKNPGFFENEKVQKILPEILINNPHLKDVVEREGSERIQKAVQDAFTKYQKSQKTSEKQEEAGKGQEEKK